MRMFVVNVRFVADENRDINGHPDDDLKRQRSQYNGDQLYSNVGIRPDTIKLWKLKQTYCFSYGQENGVSKMNINCYQISAGPGQRQDRQHITIPMADFQQLELPVQQRTYTIQLIQ